ncbi:glycoside hydrolase family 13 protein [Babjeviella inositovora NRRL Y-12698]|uniref:Glycogen debranching enzyme n=1 Tax=Babjeviella inositovora NRRL Y-12698 TaxID=984486 RepID=A0A1E3QR04_9ASCO|nr:glycoside hydrolase family 13 protein [Babjeviella inositovora NRRL Y-12698]ODQ80080.1 glycoside hydrolase family 13 protein [Babjeviella inositovora NRRL Y-12698]
MQTVLLRLASTGEPLVGTGILSLPSAPPPRDFRAGDALYRVVLAIPASAKITRGGVVWTNAPPAGTPFDRTRFYKHPISGSFSKDVFLPIDVFVPGAYCYYVSYLAEQPETTRKFYFNAPCALTLNGEFLPFNAISMESIISKWMGPRSNWDEIFGEVAHKGYNMVHFTPLQTRGESNSPYSIADQLTFDPEHFADVADVEKMVADLEKNHKILSLTDIVFNHTANNSLWLQDHPDSGYNAVTAPHLQAAIALDGALLAFSAQLDALGYPSHPRTAHDVSALMAGIRTHVIAELKLWEFYAIDVKAALEATAAAWGAEAIDVPEEAKSDLPRLAKWVVSQTAAPFVLAGRGEYKLDAGKFAGILASLVGDAATASDFAAASAEARRILDEINVPLYRTYDEDLAAILSSLESRILYLRVDENGPKQGPVTDEHPLTERYFTRFSAHGTDWALANNGWIWGGNPLVDFASNQSKAYLRREVIIWGDCVKLRYGTGPEDSPYVWKRMTEYTRLCARVFHGLRIDNAHSTPLHVAEALLDVAREVNPNVYVVAELFSGSEEMDTMFVERLGLSSLIREAMQAWSVEELSRLVHRHGGRPIGSLQWLPLDEFAYPAMDEKRGEALVARDEHNLGVDATRDSASELAIPRVLQAEPVHALFMDCTHDNEMPAQKRCVEDTLPNAALVSLCACAVGSVFGYDECYPALLDVVNESRTYSWGHGIGEVKRLLLQAREEASYQSVGHLEDNEMYIHHEDQYITVRRTNAKTGKGLFLVARSKFHNAGTQELAPITLSGTRVAAMFAYSLVRTGDYVEDKRTLGSIPVEVIKLDDPAISYDAEKNETTITLPPGFSQGSIVLLSTTIDEANLELDEFLTTGAISASKDLDLYDLNALLYKCEQEERDASAGREGVYNIPGYGPLVYAGLQGWISVLKPVIAANDLAHPLMDHLRQGQWPLDYIVNRLDKYAGSRGVAAFRDWLHARFAAVKKVPYYLLPRYFALVAGVAYEALRFRALALLPHHIQHSTAFVQSLAMCLVQMMGEMNNTSVLPFANVPCMAAGLPHFSNDYMRCWGRDVFISLRGLLLATGRFEDAKTHILGFAATLKHGLIPNLLDAGRNPRYNARDAAWFFVQSVQDYVTHAPDGLALLDTRVKRRFPLDDTWVAYDSPEAFAYESSVREIVYEILARHARGIAFREANAGSTLDSQMRDEGFNVAVSVDWTTGLIHGGSPWNCGTWMDKMGESARAGSKGVPGTPRDGANVEINGLLKSCLRFVNGLHSKGAFEHAAVVKPDGEEISLVAWEALVQENFEKKFYVPEDPEEDSQFDIDNSLVNRRGIYKDVYRTSKPYEDYQLRPNFPIAMCVAPELFAPARALRALQIADAVIRGPIGMRTLDPSDYNYRPDYHNSEDSDDFATSKGRNYHQGPEWVWCMGYFLRAFAAFHVVADPKCVADGKPSTYLYQMLSGRLEGHRKWILESPWAGLTELTNRDGAECYDSSPTQAWSSACLLDLFYDEWNE